MTMTAVISAQHLCKYYDVPERDEGLGNAIRSVFRRRIRTVKAVDDVSFAIAPGEMVGFLGPNGAGKTTTLKMLSGLLHPTSGTVDVLGHRPFAREHAFLRQMTLVMGQRNNLVWDLPGADSFALSRTIYGIDTQQFTQTRDALVELLELQPLLSKPVRNLSLGERMKMEFALALMHRPQVLFLDEPTIGLDVTMQKRIREFVAAYNQRYGATVILTSHYMADVEALCKRVIVINHGTIIYDGALQQLVTQFAAHRTISIRSQATATQLASYGTVVGDDDGLITIRVAKHDVPQVTAQLLQTFDVSDIIIGEPPIDDVIAALYASAPLPA